MTFSEAFNRLKKATCPEDVFGMLNPPAQFRLLWRTIEPCLLISALEKDAKAATLLLDFWAAEMDQKLMTLSYGLKSYEEFPPEPNQEGFAISFAA